MKISLNTFHSIKWMIKWFFPSLYTGSVRRDLWVLGQRIILWRKTRGDVWAADRAKLVRLAILRYLEHRPLETPAGLSLTRDGLPTCLKTNLITAIRECDLTKIQAILSVCSITREILGGKPVDVTPLIEPWVCKDPSILKLIDKYIPEFLIDHSISPFEANWSTFHFTTKAGPNGPALTSSIVDHASLSERQKELISIIGGPSLHQTLNRLDKWKGSNLYKILNKVFKIDLDLIYFRTAKLSVRRDKEAKSRIFGILDYFTQTCLRPLHLELFRILEQLPCDRTFDQTKGITSLIPTEGSCYHSIDLKNATDRFPILVQERLLAALIGPIKARAWVELLTDRDYILPSYALPIRYGAGQPMGAYSSWSMFSLTHHLIVYIAAKEAGFSSFDNYLLLGDDIVIADDKVAKVYLQILDTLGVEVSFAKTHRSKDFFEFAKRFVYRQVEYSPFPLAGLSSVVNKYYLLFEFMNQLGNRGFTIPNYHSEPGLLRELLRIHGIVGRLAQQYQRNFEALQVLPKGVNVTREQAGVFARTLSRLFPITFSCNLSLERLGDIIAFHANEMLTRSTAKSSEMALNRIQAWTSSVQVELRDNPSLGPDDQSELTDHWLETIPPLAALRNRSIQTWDSIPQEMVFWAEDPDDGDLFPANSGNLHTFIWDRINHTKILVLPDAQGIIPDRSAYQLSGSRAGYIKLLVSVIMRYNDGLKPD